MTLKEFALLLAGLFAGMGIGIGLMLRNRLALIYSPGEDEEDAEYCKVGGTE